MEDAPFRSLLSGDGLEGWSGGSGPAAFRREGDALIGVAGDWGDRLMTGADGWTDCEYAADVTILEGGLAQLHYRIGGDGHRCWYTLDLLPKEQQARLAWADNREGGPGLVPLLTKPCPLVLGREYELRVLVRGRSITGYVDGQEVGTVADDRSPSGRVGVGLFGRARFRSPRVKLLG